MSGQYGSCISFQLRLYATYHMNLLVLLFFVLAVINPFKEVLTV